MSTKNNEITTLSHEQAYDETEKMTHVDRYDADGCEIIRGIHPQWGPTVLIFPMVGDVIGVPVMAEFQPEIMALKNATAEFTPQPN